MSEAATPIRRQYLEIKRRFPNTIVFFRMGDFYETFDDDARTVAQELDITLTTKPMGKGLRVPLAGFPHHSLQLHLKRLVTRGFKVAICEQMHDPKTVKGLVERDVVRVVTPGTVVEDELLSAAVNNYLAAVVPEGSVRRPGVHAVSRPEGLRPGMNGLAYVDVTTGEFCCAEVSDTDLATELARLDPAEVLLPDGVDLPAPWAGTMSAIDPRLVDADEAERCLREHLRVASLDGYGLRGRRLAVAAAGAILAYLGDNRRAALANLTDLEVYNPSRFLVLDAPARRHLELFESLREGTRKGSLLESIDLARTAMGSRLMARWLGQPLLDVGQIDQRLDGVERFVTGGLSRTLTRERLGEVPDIERIVGRVVAGTAMPRDLAALRRALETLPRLIEAAEAAGALEAEKQASAEQGLALLKAALADDPAPVAGEGGVIREGFSPELDAARILTADVRKALAELESLERDRSGIRSLRVAYNRVFGYYIEVSKVNLAMVPDDFRRKQTLAGAERFVTPRLKELEERIEAAREAIGELESALFRQVVAQLAGLAPGLRAIAELVAMLDVYSALAEVAARQGFVRPVVNDGEALKIRDGRHPVVERHLGDGRFVPNDTELDGNDAQIVVLTGPNMAGKSTFLRQVALITLLAQIGSFVPALSAEIGVVDRIFTRIGAQDDVGRGESTFMVEMLETAAILRSATRRSLVLFDEVGRGTSTYDGLAIARSVVEYLHAHPERAAKTLFATHYHEMTRLAGTLPRVRNFSVAVTEQDGRVVFLHRIVPGGADRSYGIHVAELAGMPAAVITRAREVLSALEENGRNGNAGSSRRRVAPQPQLPLVPATSAVEEELAALDLDALTPLQAMNRLYELKGKVTGNR